MKRFFHILWPDSVFAYSFMILGCIPGLPYLLSAKPDTELVTEKNGISIKINSNPSNRKLSIAKFNNPIGRVILRNDGQETDLKLMPEPTFWNITLPDDQDLEGTYVFVETIGEPYLAGQPVLVLPETNGSIKLHAHLGITVGEKLRYEPQPHKNTIGYWTIEDDYAEWHFQPKETGQYRVEILQGCGKGQGGSELAIQVGEEKLKYTVKDTGHFQNFEKRTVGSFMIDSTEAQTIQVKVLKKIHKAVMDVRLIELIPTDQS